MNKLSKIITGLVTSSFIIGGFSAFLAHEYKKNIKVSQAAESNTTTGLYKKITSASELSSGDTVVLVYDKYGENRQAIQKVFSPYGGNSKALSLTFIESRRAVINEYLLLQSTYAEEFYVEKGMTTTSFAFKGLGSFNNKYLGIDGGNGVGDVSSKSLSSSWDLEYHTGFDEEDNYFTIKTSNTDDRRYLWYNGNIGGISLNEYDQAEMQIYVKQNVTNIGMYSEPTQKTYYYGDEINLSGMKVDIMINGALGDSIVVSYDRCPVIFSIQNSVAYYSDYVNVTVFAGASFSRNMNFEIEVIDNPNYTYTRVTSLTKDFRGTYIFVFVDENDNSKSAIFNSTLTGDAIDNEGNYSRGGFTVSGNKISGLSYAQTQMTVEIGRYDQNDASRYYMKTPSDKYLKAKYGSGYYNGFELADTLEDTIMWGYSCEGKFCTSDGDITMYIDASTVFYFWNIDEPYFSFVEAGRYDPSDNEYYRPAYLYKLDTTSEISSEVNNFVSGFKTNIKDACDNSGQTNNITSNMWNAQKTAFLALSVDAQGILANVTYNHGSETPGSMKDIIDLYDYIVSKYGYEDFMNRGAANTIQNNAHPANIVPIKVNNTNAMIITTAVTIISSSILFAVLLFIKKRKSLKVI